MLYTNSYAISPSIEYCLALLDNHMSIFRDPPRCQIHGMAMLICSISDIWSMRVWNNCCLAHHIRRCKNMNFMGKRTVIEFMIDYGTQMGLIWTHAFIDPIELLNCLKDAETPHAFNRMNQRDINQNFYTIFMRSLCHPHRYVRCTRFLLSLSPISQMCY